MKCLMNSDATTSIRSHIFDLDSISAYPSAGVACNISKQTTMKELVGIEGKDKDEFMYDNIDLSSGAINSISYCSNMYNFPKLSEVDELLKDYIKKKKK